MPNTVNKNDRRYIKTHKIIRQTAFDLAEKKGWKNVRVTDVAKAADINRNTFYIHYETIEAVFEEIEDRVAERYHRFLVETPVDEMLSDFKFFESVVKDTKENVIKIKKSGRSEFLFIKLKNFWLDFFENVYMTNHTHKKRRDIIIEYMSSIMFVPFMEYLRNPEHYDAKEYFTVGVTMLKDLKQVYKQDSLFIK